MQDVQLEATCHVNIVDVSGVDDGVPVADGIRTAVVVDVLEMVSDAVDDTDVDVVDALVAEEVAVLVCVAVGVIEEVGVADGVSDALTDADQELEGLSDRVLVVVPVGVSDIVGVAVMVGVRVRDGVGDIDGDGVALGLGSHAPGDAVDMV